MLSSVPQAALDAGGDSRSHGLRWDDIRATEMTAEKLSPTVVLLTYRADRPSWVALRSSIWVWTYDSGWTMGFHQGTTASPN